MTELTESFYDASTYLSVILHYMYPSMVRDLSAHFRQLTAENRMEVHLRFGY